ncbi:MAG: AmmeMemoRadiSam system protein B, partial [Candidatus Altiarchaeales archaeon]|nr:AmmeMemoRadiSam system protein B [Candidatus Altiarchaeales archaeon]
MKEIKRVRESVIAGSWYPGSKRELESMLDNFLEKTEKKDLGRIKVLIAPHAGYLYSGQVAAFSFKQVEDADYKKVIIMGPSHRHPLLSLSIGNYTHYKTPLGEVEVSPLAKEMIRKSDLINSIDDVHSMEHSLEIEIPFLQMVLRDFEIIPIVAGRLSEAQREE